MDFRYQCVNFKSILMYIYDYCEGTVCEGTIICGWTMMVGYGQLRFSFYSGAVIAVD